MSQVPRLSVDAVASDPNPLKPPHDSGTVHDATNKVILPPTMDQKQPDCTPTTTAVIAPVTEQNPPDCTPTTTAIIAPPVTEQNPPGHQTDPDTERMEPEHAVREEQEIPVENVQNDVEDGNGPGNAEAHNVVPEPAPEHACHVAPDCPGPEYNIGNEQAQCEREHNQDGETMVKQVAGLGLNEQRAEILNPPRDNEHNSSGEGPAAVGNEEVREIGVINEGPERGEQAVPIPDHAEPVERDPKHLLQDKWEHVITIFANPNQFFRFASSSVGLKMNDKDIKHIQSSDKDPHDQMIDIMRKWTKNNEGVTCKELEDIVAGYFEQKRGPTAIPEENHNQAQAANTGLVRPQQNQMRMEDVFETISRSFASMTDFKKFARATRGLRLDSDDVNQIETDHRRNSNRQKLEMLRLWRQNAGDPTPQMLLQIRERYRTFNR